MFSCHVIYHQPEIFCQVLTFYLLKMCCKVSDSWLCSPAAPWRLHAAQNQRPHGPPDLLCVPDPAVPLHVLEVQPAAGGSSLRRGLSHASALQPGKPADSGSTDLLVSPAFEESQQTLPEREDGTRQGPAEDGLKSPTKGQISRLHAELGFEPDLLIFLLEANKNCSCRY